MKDGLVVSYGEKLRATTRTKRCESPLYIRYPQAESPPIISETMPVVAFPPVFTDTTTYRFLPEQLFYDWLNRLSIPHLMGVSLVSTAKKRELYFQCQALEP